MEIKPLPPTGIRKHKQKHTTTNTNQRNVTKKKTLIIFNILIRFFFSVFSQLIHFLDSLNYEVHICLICC